MFVTKFPSFLDPQIPSVFQDNNSTQQKGLYDQKSLGIGFLSPFFNEYTIGGVEQILKLRLKDHGVDLSKLAILSGHYVFAESYNNIDKMLLCAESVKASARVDIVLSVISLYGQHAVGLMFFQDKVYYIDSTNEVMPPLLNTVFSNAGFAIEQLIVEQQKYSNCGPEVIENFMLYLTGERLSQEDAVIYNSTLVERNLVENLEIYKNDVLAQGCSASFNKSVEDFVDF